MMKMVKTGIRRKRISRKEATAKRPVADAAEAKRLRVISAIRSLPAGKVSTYGAVARAAGWPGAAPARW